jgi:glycosyltransferase involved in cell wall biosynthesis
MFVSVITTTKNRSHFLPALLECYRTQVWPHKDMEWLLMDDSEFEEQETASGLIQNWIAKTQIPNVHHIRICSSTPTGSKLNQLIRMARGDILVVMDDDDWYSPYRVSSVVDAFRLHPEIDLAGCSKVYMQFEEEPEALWVAGPYHDQHALHCTMAFRRRYFATHSYDNEEVCAVERQVTNGFTEPMIQLYPRHTILHKIHSSNTYPFKQSIGLLRRSSLELAKFIGYGNVDEQVSL